MLSSSQLYCIGFARFKNIYVNKLKQISSVCVFFIFLSAFFQPTTCEQNVFLVISVPIKDLSRMCLALNAMSTCHSIASRLLGCFSIELSLSTALAWNKAERASLTTGVWETFSTVRWSVEGAVVDLSGIRSLWRPAGCGRLEAPTRLGAVSGLRLC